MAGYPREHGGYSHRAVETSSDPCRRYHLRDLFAILRWDSLMGFPHGWTMSKWSSRGVDRAIAGPPPPSHGHMPSRFPLKDHKINGTRDGMRLCDGDGGAVLQVAILRPLHLQQTPQSDDPCITNHQEPSALTYVSNAGKIYRGSPLRNTRPIAGSTVGAGKSDGNHSDSKPKSSTRFA
mgnify:CR=1 FL=1